MEKLITVVLTSYNRTRLLEEAIQSVRSQTYKNLEIFIIDDGSPQTTRDIITSHAEQDPRIIYIQTDKKDSQRKKVTDYAENINTCISQSTGEYFAYLTCDDKYYPNHISTLLRALEEDPNKYIVFGLQQIVRYNKINHTFKKISIRNPNPNPLPQAACQVDHNSFMHRRSTLELVPEWPTHISIYGCADAAYFELLNKHWPHHKISTVTTEHRLHKDSIQAL